MLIFKSTQVAKFSSNWNNGTNAGAFYWYLNYATSTVSRSIGARLTIFMNLVLVYLASWQNRTTKRRIGRYKVLEDLANYERRTS